MTYEVWLAKKEATLLNVTAASDPASNTEVQVSEITGGGGGGNAIVVKDEGSILTNSVSILNFTGAGVTASSNGSNVTIAVTSGNPIAVEDEGNVLTAGVQTLNFTGSGVTATTDGFDNITVNITGGSGGGANVSVKDEGLELTNAVSILNFTGAGVTSSSNGSNVTIIIPGGGTLGGGSAETEIKSDIFTGTGACTVFTLSANSDAESVFVFVNGVSQKPNVDYQVSNNVLTLNTAPSVGTKVEARTIADVTLIKGSKIEVDRFSGTGSCTSFTLTEVSNTKEVLIYIDGVSQKAEVDYQVSGNTVTFNTAPLSGTSIEARSFIRVPVITPSQILSNTYTGDGACTVFAMPNTQSHTTTSTFIFVDGVTQVPGVDYTVSGGNVSFTLPPENSAVIEIRSINGIQVGYYGNSSNIFYETTMLELSNASYSFTSGGFANANDSISRTYIARGTTTNSTETEIFLNGSNRIPVRANTTVFYTADIVARRTDATGNSAGFYIKGVVDNFSGTVADVGDLYEVVVAEDDASFAADMRADDTNNSINIYVTGATGKTVRWTALVKTVEVAD